MTPEDILKHDPIVLTQEQRELFFEQGFLAVEGLVSDEWLDCLRRRSDEMTERSRQFTESNKEYDLSPDHTADNPYVRRLRAPIDRHPDFWEFAHNSAFTDVAADLVGPDVKFHSCKLNYKHPGGGEVVKWHQDIPAWPHTNFSPVTLGVYFHDVGDAEGPLACIPGSHKGELYSHFHPDRTWSGSPIERRSREGKTGERGQSNRKGGNDYCHQLPDDSRLDGQQDRPRTAAATALCL